ncbi:MAG: hypothetical protein ACOYOQ_00560 [Microthrixaceae bacterium]
MANSAYGEVAEAAYANQMTAPRSRAERAERLMRRSRHHARLAAVYAETYGPDSLIAVAAAQQAADDRESATDLLSLGLS